MDIIQERQGTHGRYSETAEIAQKLKSVIYAASGARDLTYIQRESLDLICTKIARIVVGNSSHPDHWLDISGYGDLALREIEQWQDSQRRAELFKVNFPRVEHEEPSDSTAG